MVAEAVMRRTILTLAAAAGLVVAGVAAYAPDRPSISFDSKVPDDVRRLASETWDRFVDTFPRRECLQPVQLTVAWTYPDRAEYDSNRRLVTLRVPGTAPNLEATLAHEFAHHLEFTCLRTPEPLADLKPAFLTAQGLPVDAPWFEGETWETTPSEQFAEAVAEVVTGRPPLHQRVLVTEEALALIRAWARMTPARARLSHST